MTILDVEVENLNFAYNTDFRIRNLSLRIEENSVYALTGNNGSGKTTLLRLLVGLLKPESGMIKLFGEPLSRNKNQLWQIRQKIGFLFQNPDDQLFAPSIEEDIAFGARNLKLDEDEVKMRVEWALDAVGLTDYKTYSPFNLSWGQKKRACLAGLLVLKPKLLLLDEPFSNLDIKAIISEIAMLEKLRKDEQITILFTTHNLFFVRNWADKMLLLNDGEGIYEGPPKEGLNSPNVRKILGDFDDILATIQKVRGP